MTVYDNFANALNKATDIINIDKEDSLTIEHDATYKGGYRVRIDWQAGHEGDSIEWLTLKELYFENIDNKRINQVLGQFRNRIN